MLFIVPQVKVVPGPPAVRERLQANRAEFVLRHSSLRDLAARFARLAALLDAAVSSMHLGEPLGPAAAAAAQGPTGKLAMGSKLPEHEHEHALRAGGSEPSNPYPTPASCAPPTVTYLSPLQ